MRTVLLFLTLASGLVACGNEYVCADVIEEGDYMTGLDSVDDFVGVDTCYYAFADPGSCEDDGGTAYVMDEMNGTSATCPENGYTVECNGGIYVKDAADCPENADTAE